MRLAARIFAIVLVLALALLGLWRILVTGMSDHFVAEGKPQQALDWDSNNPVAMAALARQQRDQGKQGEAAESARALLRREPLNGQGFVVLAGLAGTETNKAHATLMSTMAIRRAPYVLAPRAWLAEEQLRQGQYPQALENLDQIMRISPEQQTPLFPVLIKLAADAEFAEALAVKLATQTPWRASFVESALISGTPQELAAVFSALQRHGSLDAITMGRWIDRLVKDGQWGEAYARWVGGMQAGAPSRLRHVYNGDFEKAPSGGGFNWRLGDSAGVLVDRAVLVSPDSGHALRLTFFGRRVDAIPLHQWLMLGPGSYRLRFRAMAQDLRGDRGVQWMIRCLQDGKELAASEPLNGHFDWRLVDVDFNVPAQACQAQELSLRNAGAAAAGKIILGAILFDDIAIDQVESNLKSANSPKTRQ